MSAASPTIEINQHSCRITVGHSQVRHPVQRRTPHQQLSGLSLKATRTDSLAKDRFDSKDLRLSQRATMITALSFPLSAPLLPDLSQVLITNVALRFRITV